MVKWFIKNDTKNTKVLNQFLGFFCLPILLGALFGCQQKEDSQSKPFVTKIPDQELYQTFEGHYPCAKTDAAKGCQRLKVGLALYQPSTNQTAPHFRFGFIKVGVDNTRHMWEGHWSMIPTPDFSKNVQVLHLEGSLPKEYQDHLMVAPHTLLLLKKGSSKIRKGDASETFTLTQTDSKNYTMEDPDSH